MNRLAFFVFSLVLAPACAHGAATATALDSPPFRIGRLAPVYPPKAIELKAGDGSVLVRYVVNEAGIVTKARAIQSTNPCFEDAAVQTALQGRFHASVVDGKKVSRCLDEYFQFWSPETQRKIKNRSFRPPSPRPFVYSPTTKAVQKTDVVAHYPDTLLPLRLHGEVQVTFTVDAEGRVQAPAVLSATHADFVPPALAAVSAWTFSPAMQGDLAVASPMGTVVRFDVTAPTPAGLDKGGR